MSPGRPAPPQTPDTPTPPETSSETVRPDVAPPSAPRGVHEPGEQIPEPPLPPVPPGSGIGHDVTVQEWTSDRPPPPVTIKTTFVALMGLRETEMNEELVLIDPVADRYFSLNRTGAFIWRMVVNGEPLAKVIDKLVSAYSLDEEVGVRVVLHFAQQLVNARLIVPLQQGHQP